MSTNNLDSVYTINKIEATKYILKGLCDWYYELNPSKKEKDNNNLSILKSLKLIFFLSTVTYDGKSLLDNPFDNFFAMPLGPVEEDVYKFFKSSTNIVNYSKTNYHELGTPNLKTEHISLIDNLIEVLKSINIDLINKSAFYLVDLTHEWSCWIDNYKKAELEGKNSLKIPVIDIKNSKEKAYTF